MANNQFTTRFPAPKTTPNMYDTVPEEAAITFLTEQVQIPGLGWKTEREKVSKTVKRAIKAGQLRLIEKEVVFGHFIEWACGKPAWKPKLGHLAKLTYAHGESVSSATAKSTAVKLPPTLTECHQLIQELSLDVARLESSVQELQPKAKK